MDSPAHMDGAQKEKRSKDEGTAAVSQPPVPRRKPDAKYDGWLIREGRDHTKWAARERGTHWWREYSADDDDLPYDRHEVLPRSLEAYHKRMTEKRGANAYAGSEGHGIYDAVFAETNAAQPSVLRLPPGPVNHWEAARFYGTRKVKDFYSPRRRIEDDKDAEGTSGRGETSNDNDKRSGRSTHGGDPQGGGEGAEQGQAEIGHRKTKSADQDDDPLPKLRDAFFFPERDADLLAALRSGKQLRKAFEQRRCDAAQRREYTPALGFANHQYQARLCELAEHVGIDRAVSLDEDDFDELPVPAAKAGEEDADENDVELASAFHKRLYEKHQSKILEEMSAYMLGARIKVLAGGELRKFWSWTAYRDGYAPLPAMTSAAAYFPPLLRAMPWEGDEPRLGFLDPARGRDADDDFDLAKFSFRASLPYDSQPAPDLTITKWPGGIVNVMNAKDHYHYESDERLTRSAKLTWWENAVKRRSWMWEEKSMLGLGLGFSPSPRRSGRRETRESSKTSGHTVDCTFEGSFGFGGREFRLFYPCVDIAKGITMAKLREDIAAELCGRRAMAVNLRVLSLAVSGKDDGVTASVCMRPKKPLDRELRKFADSMRSVDRAQSARFAAAQKGAVIEDHDSVSRIFKFEIPHQGNADPENDDENDVDTDTTRGQPTDESASRNDEQQPRAAAQLVSEFGGSRSPLSFPTIPLAPRGPMPTSSTLLGGPHEPFYMMVMQRSGKPRFVKKTVEEALRVPHAKIELLVKGSASTSSIATAPRSALKATFHVHVVTDRRLEAMFFGRRTQHAILLCLGLAADFTGSAADEEDRSPRVGVDGGRGCTQDSNGNPSPALVEKSACSSCFRMRSRPKFVRLTGTHPLPPTGAGTADPLLTAGRAERGQRPGPRRRANGFPASVIARCRGGGGGASESSEADGDPGSVSPDSAQLRVMGLPADIVDRDFAVVEIDQVLFCRIPINPLRDEQERAQEQHAEADEENRLARKITWPLPFHGCREPHPSRRHLHDEEDSSINYSEDRETYPTVLPRSNLEEHSAVITHENGHESAEVVAQLMAFPDA